MMIIIKIDKDRTYVTKIDMCSTKFKYYIILS